MAENDPEMVAGIARAYVEAINERRQLKDRIMALEPDELGRISKGLVLAMIMGEVQ